MGDSPSESPSMKSLRHSRGVALAVALMLLHAPVALAAGGGESTPLNLGGSTTPGHPHLLVCGQLEHRPDDRRAVHRDRRHLRRRVDFAHRQARQRFTRTRQGAGADREPSARFGTLGAARACRQRDPADRRRGARRHADPPLHRGGGARGRPRAARRGRGRVRARRKSVPSAGSLETLRRITVRS